MNPTKIEWCDVTWNPVTGCRHGCSYCFARKQAQRFGGAEPHSTYGEFADDNWHRGDNPFAGPDHVPLFVVEKPLYVRRKNGKLYQAPYPFRFDPTFHRYRLEEPESQQEPKNIFVVDMGDLFGDWVPEHWIREVFAACGRAPWHRYLFLTKNPKGIDQFIDNDSCEERGCSESLEFFAPFWFGTSVTCAGDLEKAMIISDLREGHHFLSIEPIHGPINLNLGKVRCPNCGSQDIYEDNPRTRGDASPIYCDDCEWEGSSRDELKPGIELGNHRSGNRKQEGKDNPTAVMGGGYRSILPHSGNSDFYEKQSRQSLGRTACSGISVEDSD